MAAKRSLQVLSARSSLPIAKTIPLPSIQHAIIPLQSGARDISSSFSLSRSDRSSRRHLSITSAIFEQQSNPSSTPWSVPTKPEIRPYDFREIQSLVKSHQEDPSSRSPILIDVREPSEIQATGRIPTAVNIPITSSPDFPFMPPEDFEDKFGFARPGKDTEVVFYCKAGVRSRAAARLAQHADFGGKLGEYGGSWVDWEKQGGEVQKG